MDKLLSLERIVDLKSQFQLSGSITTLSSSKHKINVLTPDLAGGYLSTPREVDPPRHMSTQPDSTVGAGAT